MDLERRPRLLRGTRVSLPEPSDVQHERGAVEPDFDSEPVGRDERLVSHHVRLLRNAGLARSERDGKMVMYELTERGRALLAAVVAQGIAA